MVYGIYDGMSLTHYTTREDFAVRHLLTDFTIIKSNPSFYSSTELFHLISYKFRRLSLLGLVF